MRVQLYYLTESLSWALLGITLYVVFTTEEEWFLASLPWATASLGLMALSIVLERYHRQLNDWLGGLLG